MRLSVPLLRSDPDTPTGAPLASRLVARLVWQRSVDATEQRPLLAGEPQPVVVERPAYADDVRARHANPFTESRHVIAQLFQLNGLPCDHFCLGHRSASIQTWQSQSALCGNSRSAFTTSDA